MYIGARDTRGGERIDPRIATRVMRSRTSKLPLRPDPHFRNKNREVGSSSRGYFRLKGFSSWNPPGVDVLTRVYIDVMYEQTDIYIDNVFNRHDFQRYGGTLQRLLISRRYVVRYI